LRAVALQIRTRWGDLNGAGAVTDTSVIGFVPIVSFLILLFRGAYGRKRLELDPRVLAQGKRKSFRGVSAG